MEDLWNLLKTFLLVLQFLAAIVGCFYFVKLKNSYWKWFAVYLVAIIIYEYSWTYLSTINDTAKYSLALIIGLPLEFIFFYWLYALKSLKRKKLFILSSVAYIVLSGASAYFFDGPTAKSFSFNVGTLLLTILVILEYSKQIRNDDILKFRENKMFYINLGVILFYVGSMPFVVFQKYLLPDFQQLVEYYFIYFLVSNCIMYLLFTASFIWGKEQS